MSESCRQCDSIDRQEYRHLDERSMICSQKQRKQKDRNHLKEPSEHMQNPGVMVSVATITDIKGLAHSHVSEFSRRHPTISTRYVMPWKQDMVNRKLITRHADLAGLYKGPHEDSLFLRNKERLCHGEERHIIMEKMKIPPQHGMTDFPLHSPLSRYQSHVIKQKTRILGSYI
ncbi:sperm-associated microtubule inner protein 10 [Dendropsophus ebraccatus]|uniref:sperm-associated microtubule inner protein 10 n=1 Tax=Dendropsophus ebraccatus TaxID=150705 RepID=UPI00383199AE